MPERSLTGPLESGPDLCRVYRSKLDQLMPEGSPRRALLAVSGGADSTTLSILTSTLNRTQLEGYALAHFNHHLRGAESDQDEAFVRRLAGYLGVPFFGGDWKPETRHEQEHANRNIQAAARKARYDFLFMAAQSFKARVILTAHNQRDLVESVLHNLGRGGGEGAWCGIRERIFRKGYWILRPLLLQTPETIRQFLDQLNQPYRTDSSNLKTKYQRNYLRLVVLPKIREWCPGFEGWILQLALLAQHQESEVIEQLQKVLGQSVQVGTALILPRRLIQELPEGKQVLLLQHLLREGDHWPHLRKHQTEMILKQFNAGGCGTHNLPGNWRLTLTPNTLQVQSN